MANQTGNCTCSITSSPVSIKGLEPMANVFKALGHPIRVMIIEMLIGGERCVCELQEHSGRDISTISSHLNILKNNKLVVSEQRGKNVYYSLSCPCLKEVLRMIGNTISR